MLHKMMIALFAAASVGMLVPSVASLAAALAAAVSVQPLSEVAVSTQPVSAAEVSAQPLLGAVDFAAEPSQPMVSAVVVSTTGADLRSVRLQSD